MSDDDILIPAEKEYEQIPAGTYPAILVDGTRMASEQSKRDPAKTNHPFYLLFQICGEERMQNGERFVQGRKYPNLPKTMQLNTTGNQNSLVKDMHSWQALTANGSMPSVARLIGTPAMLELVHNDTYVNIVRITPYKGTGDLVIENYTRPAWVQEKADKFAEEQRAIKTAGQQAQRQAQHTVAPEVDLDEGDIPF